VGSRTLLKETGLELSSATVRNVMADCEEMGLVSSLHVSSGQVPTDPGYRLFIDSLLPSSDWPNKKWTPCVAS